MEMITKIEGKCSYEGCEKPATHIACGRRAYNDDDEALDDGHPKPACYCQSHAEIIADENGPEYLNECPNCGCLHGVN